MAQTQTKPAKKRDIDGAIYTITFAGSYFAQNGTQNTEKPYRITVKMNHEHVTKHGAKSVFKRKIAPALMIQKYPDFIGLATYHIVSSECDRPELLAKNIEVLSMEGLCEYIDMEELDINVHLYDSAEELRAAVRSYNEDPDAYALTEKALIAKYGGERQIKDEVLKLNADFDTEEDAEDDEEEITNAARGAKQSEAKAKTKVAAKQEDKKQTAEKMEDV